ncbi:cupin domain-containing protein [Sinorhizobium sp. 7-81]|uniref:helix-turn-helix domain-containing protein n=1 Tax=Sinorhizobium sp. 8-89 TaxID=3049089 RepID=UPI0024C41106|nr:cupin domain-containing protein [Sinorhizobium sp. 8-89]MDK1491347.1 cupin domain-containing protein [Sinorhizobium sp. 8-89]
MTVSNDARAAPESANSAPQPRIGALVRARRRQMHMTLQELSDVAGVSVGYISQVERDLATPSLGTLAQIARGLDTEISHFILAPAIDTGLSRAEDRMVFSVGGSPVAYERIGADFAGNQLSSFVITIPPGHRSEVFSHEGEEIVFVLDGEILFGLDGEQTTLTDGDGLHFRGIQPHYWWNRTDKAARILWTGTLPLFRPRTAASKAAGHAEATGTPARPAKTKSHRKQEKR